MDRLAEEVAVNAGSGHGLGRAAAALLVIEYAAEWLRPAAEGMEICGTDDLGAREQRVVGGL